MKQEPIYSTTTIPFVKEVENLIMADACSVMQKNLNLTCDARRGHRTDSYLNSFIITALSDLKKATSSENFFPRINEVMFSLLPYNGSFCCTHTLYPFEDFVIEQGVLSVVVSTLFLCYSRGLRCEAKDPKVMIVSTSTCTGVSI